MHNLECKDSEGDGCTIWRWQLKYIFDILITFSLFGVIMEGHVLDIFFKKRKKVNVFFSYHGMEADNFFNQLFEVSCK